jgi:hypothetical protein
MASQQPTAALPNKLAQAAYEEAWPQKWLDKLTAAILSRDRKTVRRIKFGRRICELRFLLDMSQAEAADAAHEMDRGQWNRIENAKHIP